MSVLSEQRKDNVHGVKISEQMKVRIIIKLKQKSETDFFFCSLHTTFGKVKMGRFHSCLSVAALLYSAE